MVLENIEKSHYYTCDATDEKPTKNILENSILKINGTDEEYVFNGTEWIKNFFTTGRNGLINVTDENTEIVGFKLSRAKIIIQNNGIEPVFLKFGSEADINGYDYSLKASSRPNSGDGGVYTSETLKYSINAITESGNSFISVFEEVLQ